MPTNLTIPDYIFLTSKKTFLTLTISKISTEAGLSLSKKKKSAQVAVINRWTTSQCTIVIQQPRSHSQALYCVYEETVAADSLLSPCPLLLSNLLFYIVH